MGALYSIRMRASRGRMHISGAERIVKESDIHEAVGELIRRAKKHERGAPESITVTVDSLTGVEPLRLAALPITDLKLGGCGEGRERAIIELVRAGVTEEAARSAMKAIT